MLSGQRASLLAALLLILPTLATTAEENAFIERFTGQWSGGGPYKRTARMPAVTVKCTLAGNRSESRIKVGGTCRAAIVITRQITMDVTYDPASDSYSGTYKGEMNGLAQLAGKRKGDAVVFQVTWPEPLNGDRSATMAIESSGDGVMHLTMSDKTSPDGPVAVMWDLTFRR